MLFGLFGLLFPECVPSMSTDTADTSDPQTAWIAGIRFTCDPEGWSYEIIAWGEPGDGTLEIYDESTNYDEAHEMTLPDWSDDEQAWIYTVELERVHAEEDVVASESTLFACTDSDGGVNWHIIVEDLDGNEEDCAVFGSSPETLGFDECSLWAEES
ncbi:MAG TPA: hypothetical protein QGF58_08515 [Myxococcota bacterium]|nr:hypothetical protein [Myxococcota bacterium]